MKRKIAGILAALLAVSAPAAVPGAEFADGAEQAVIAMESDSILTGDGSEGKSPEEIDADEEVFYSETEASREETGVFGDGFEDETEEELSEDGYAYSITYDGTVVIEEYYYDMENVIIPETLAGRKVVGIQDSAFEGKKSLLSVYIPDCIKCQNLILYTQDTPGQNLLLYSKTLQKSSTF